MRAIISVYDKTGVVAFAQGLSALNVEIYSTGKTAQALAEASLPVHSISEITGFPEILDGRVKTLHPAVHGGILARRDRDAHMAELEEHHITPIDLVVCNLYPFSEAVAQPDVTLEAALEEIDIGGVTLLRAAAKNFPSVTVVVRPEDYAVVLEEIQTQGSASVETRRKLAAIAFQHTALYDTAIAEYLRRGTSDDLFPEKLTLGLRRLMRLKYGENPHQQAALYAWGGTPAGLDERAGATADSATDIVTGNDAGNATAHPIPPSVAGARQLQGKELGFNNLLDLDAALNAVASFKPPTAVVVKHTNPCGLACGDSLVESYRRAHSGDPISAYGGILGFNREVDEETARELSQIFYEAIIAPGYSPEALAVLAAKKNLRLLTTDTPIGPQFVKTDTHDPYQLDVRRVSGGLLVQSADMISESDIPRKVVSEREPTLKEVTDLLFAWKVVQQVKSNAIVLAHKLMVVGVGAGQMNRVYSVRIAVDRAGDRARGSVLASDAFFPFADGVEMAAKAGVTAIIQPGGSIRDGEVIKAANKSGIAMIFTGQRHFRH
ncbi:MAG TPA: bifunctional phosphoribosylaminoimidazolecarboxamide formyltransferase/inosine monophosphate cyclohydrolase [Ktedonobacterales bacterium]|jgi:phosphoribosylaminoimidazolecarboxamide formyltransferase/IMP cyclohydrolase|nr:bifunctional phosphoribosylaminoimidazolecarboxamide formyltransferase/inosine monophosphate cyclohydrolase [Ktedonobacterales bacterium]